jgi:hypothetical protein
MIVIDMSASSTARGKSVSAYTSPVAINKHLLIFFQGYLEARTDPAGCHQITKLFRCQFSLHVLKIFCALFGALFRTKLNLKTLPTFSPGGSSPIYMGTQPSFLYSSLLSPARNLFYMATAANSLF